MKRSVAVALAAGIAVLVPQLLISSGVQAGAISIACLCLVLWISEIVPPFVPTLVLWTLVPLILGRSNPEFSISHVLSWAADPVLALFFGGLVLGVATQKSGFDKHLVRQVISSSKDSFQKFLILVIALTAFLSMWMSNVAAAVLVLACLKPILPGLDHDDVLRRTTLLGVAIAADLGGIATPIGTGPNAIAIAYVSPNHPISFGGWMLFALPLTIGMLALAYAMLFWRSREKSSTWEVSGVGDSVSGDRSNEKTDYRFLAILIGTVIFWLSEPITGIPASVVSLGSAAVIFLSGCLTKEDLRKIDWSTLLLIAGGITLGRLLEHSAVLHDLANYISLSRIDPTVTLFILCLTSAFLAALMSNTATAILLIPLAVSILGSPATAILIAISASFGIPFIISTPPNAAAHGYGGLRFSDLFIPGMILMILGCLVVALTGPHVLRLVGFA